MSIPGARRILFAAASPSAEEIVVLAEMSQDSYGGTFFAVRLEGAAGKAEVVMEGTNTAYSDAPVWSPDGSTVYFTFDNGSFSTLEMNWWRTPRPVPGHRRALPKKNETGSSLS